MDHTTCTMYLTITRVPSGSRIKSIFSIQLDYIDLNFTHATTCGIGVPFERKWITLTGDRRCLAAYHSGTPLVLTTASTWYAPRLHRMVSTWFKEKYGCTGIGDNLRKMTDEARGGGGAVIKAGTAARKTMWWWRDIAYLSVRHYAQ